MSNPEPTGSRRRFRANVGVLLAAYLAAVLADRAVHADALEKLQPDKLEAVHQAIGALRAERHDVPRAGPWTEYRANLHVHSFLSHDSRGALADIVKAAKA